MFSNSTKQMSSDLYVIDSSLDHHSSPEMISCDGDLFFSDLFSPFYDPSSLDIVQEFSTNHNSQNPEENYNYNYNSNSNTLETFNPGFLSSSPPSHQLENLSLYQTAHLQPPPNGPNNCSSLENGSFLSCLEGLEVKIEECQVGFESYNNYQPFVPNSFSGDNGDKMTQSSFSSNSFDGKPGYLFQPRFDTLLEAPNYQCQAFKSPENCSFMAGHLRRVCSTGDLQNITHSGTTQRSLSGPLATESSFTEEGNFKIGRYSSEERKERISKYRAKRNHRNFTKTIKYACRKTLADNRPRIRGRFARNDETVEIPKAACSAIDKDDDELWFDGLHDEEERGTMAGRGIGFISSFGQPAFHQYYGYQPFP